MSTRTNEVLPALAEQHAELAGLLEPLGDGGWAAPSRCDGWSVADVVLHLAQTDELALASAQGRFDAGLETLAGGLGPAVDVDEGADRMVARERGMGPAAIHDRWRSGTEALRSALAEGYPGRRVRWVAGELSVRTLTTTRLAECWIHTGDVAAGLGVSLVPGDRLRHIARLAWRTLPYAFAREGRSMAGPVAFRLRSPGGEAWDFVPDDGPAVTTITGDAVELCEVAARRVDAGDTALRGEGPDAAAVLELVRTFA